VLSSNFCLNTPKKYQLEALQPQINTLPAHPEKRKETPGKNRTESILIRLTGSKSDSAKIDLERTLPPSASLSTVSRTV